MEDDLRAHADPMLVEGTPLDNIRLQRVIDEGNQLECQGFEDGGGRNAVREQIVELCADFEDLRGRVLGHNLAGDLGD